jgi:hypothetical protein
VLRIHIRSGLQLLRVLALIRLCLQQASGARRLTCKRGRSLAALLRQHRAFAQVADQVAKG